MLKPQANLERLEQAKERLTVVFDEVLLWLDETREDTCYVQLFDYSLPAAELAPILGFAQPPFEHVAALLAATDREEDLKFPEIRVNAPTGMSPLHFRFTEALVETRVREASPRFYDEMRWFVMRWMRALARLDIRVVKPPDHVVAMYDESAEALIFHEQLKRELRGDARSFLQELRAESLKSLKLAKLHNLSPEQTVTLQRAMASSWASARSSDPLTSPPPADSSVSSTCARGMSAEKANDKASAIIASEGYRGLRRLATRVGCSHETLRKCPSVQPYLKRKPRPSGDPRDISDVRVADASAADPLDRLVAQEDLEEMLKSLGAKERADVLGMAPQKQHELIDAWRSQQREQREDARSKGTTRRRVL